MAMTIDWQGEEFKKELEATLGRNIEAACIHLKSKVKANISGQQKVNRYKGKKRIYTSGQDPSKGGEFPKLVTSQLRDSIAYEVDRKKLTGRVGTSLKYGFYLEFGTSKMQARPFLRSTLDAENITIANILSKDVPAS